MACLRSFFSMKPHKASSSKSTKNGRSYLSFPKFNSVVTATLYGLDGPGKRIPVGGEIFSSRPNRPLCPSSLLYKGYRISFLVVKRLGCGVDHQFPSSAEVRQKVQIELYSPSGSSWFILGRILLSSLHLLRANKFCM